MSDPVFIVQDLLVRLDDGRVIESQPVRIVTDLVVRNAKGDPVEAQPVFVTSGGTGISPTAINVAPLAPIGTDLGAVTGPEGSTLSVLSGPANIVGGHLILTTAAGAAGTTQTIRVRALRAAPYLLNEQDIVITATPLLVNLTLSANTFAENLAENAVIATLGNKFAGSTVTITPNDGRWKMSPDGTQILRGASAASASGTPIAISLTETKAGASNSPHVTTGLTLTITPAATNITIAGAAFTGGVVGAAFGPGNLSASGGVAPYTWSAAPDSSALPAGATGVDGVTGKFLGSPTTPGATNGVKLRVTDANGNHADTDPFNVTVYQSGSDTTPRVIGALFFTGDVSYTAVSWLLFTDTVTTAVHGEPSTAIGWVAGTATTQPGWLTATFSTPGTKIITITRGGVTTATQVSVVDYPATAPASVYAPAAARIKASLAAAVEIPVSSSPPTITLGALNAVTAISPSQTIATSALWAGFTQKLTAGPSNHILATDRTGTKAGSQGATVGWRMNKRKCEVRVGANSGGGYGQTNYRMLFAVVTAGVRGPWQWASAEDRAVTTGTGAYRDLYDFGTDDDRIVFLIGSESMFCSEVVFEQGATITTHGLTDELMIQAFLDSQIFGVNQMGYTNSFLARLCQKLGAPVSGINNGIRTYAFIRKGGSQGVGTFLPDRIGPNAYNHAEPAQFAPKDITFNADSINDGNSDPTRLYWAKLRTFKLQRYQDPTQIIANLIQISGPADHYVTAQYNAARQAALDFDAIDNGFWLIDALAGAWVGTGGVGSTPFFPGAGAVGVVGEVAGTTLSVSGMTSGKIEPGMTLNAVLTIAVIAWVGGVATVTTTTNHGLAVGQSVGAFLAGNTPGAYNAQFTVTGTGANTLTFALATDPGPNTVQGTIALPTVNGAPYWRVVEKLSGSDTGVSTWRLNMAILTLPAGTAFTVVGDTAHLNNVGAEMFATKTVSGDGAGWAGIAAACDVIIAAGGGGGVPANAMLAEDGTPILAEDGSYLLME